MNKKIYDVCVIGGGSGAEASALKVDEKKLSCIIFERENYLGGILNQCIHNGFGLNYFKKELTGPEYANIFNEKIKNSKVEVRLNTTVLSIKKNKYFEITTLSKNGLETYFGKAVIFATGCRERPSGAISLCGTRPCGIISAGSAQKMINIYGKMIGKNFIIVGSGDIGLIMARRIRCEGGNVLGVYEIMPYPSGLKRNIVQCLNDYNIPLHLSKTVVEVVGENRVEGVYVAPVKEDFSLDLTKKEFIKCDTVILSIGLLPEVELLENLKITIDPNTNGAKVNEYLETSCEGVFSCGNALQVHDIVDNVTREGERAGENACNFILGKLNRKNPHKIIPSKNVRSINPTTFYEEEGGILEIKFRSSNIVKNCKILVKSNGKVLREIPKKIVLPAEMESVILSKKDISSDIEVSVE